MSPYHQGPPFPVSSSPIHPLDVQPSRTKRPPPLPPLPLSDYPHRFSSSSYVLSNGSHPHDLAPDYSRSLPTDWGGDATAVCPNPSGLGPQYMQNTTGSTGMTSSLPYPPSRPLASTPVGWDSDLPMNLVPYAPLAQGTEGGTTFFYRSPTPSARQRTNQACEKCRDRKTKCSGGRPTCLRCQTRGLVCEYAIEHRVRGPARARKRIIPSPDPPTSDSPARSSVVHHPYAPPAHSGHSKWDLQPISPKAQELIMAARTCWSLSDHSDESSDSSGAASFELSERIPYIGLANRQGIDFTFQQPRQGLNPLDHPSNRFHTIHRSAVDIKDQFMAPILRSSPSMPHLKPLPFQNGDPHGTPGTSLGTSYLKHTILDKEFSELPNGSLQSRCPSSSLSCTSHSHSSADDEQNPLTNGMSSNTTLTPENWSSATGNARERGDPWKTGDSFPVVASAADTEGEIPKSSSQTFSVSEWITGMDYCSSPERTSDAVDTVTPES